MQKSDRDLLYSISYRLDGMARVKLPRGKKPSDILPQVVGEKLDKLRIQEKDRDLYIMISETVLENITDMLREIASR